MDIQTIWLEYRQQLRQFLLSRVNNASDVDDLLQDILIKTYQRLHTIQQPQKLQSWLFQIARNALVDYYRKSRLALSSPYTDDLPQMFDEEEPYEQTRQELASCIRPFLNQLPDKYREALDWVDLQGKSQKALAIELGLSHSAIKSRVQRGRRMLETLFHQCCKYQFDARGNPIDFEVTQDNCSSCS